MDSDTLCSPLLDSDTVRCQEGPAGERETMRISELSRVSGVPVATIKFYLREGLVPEGVRTSPNQAQYDDAHVQRLRLVRALVGVGGLSLAATKNVLGQIDEPTGLTLDLLGTAHQAVAPDLPGEVDLAPAVSLLRRWGWDACADAVGKDDRGAGRRRAGRSGRRPGRAGRRRLRGRAGADGHVRRRDDARSPRPRSTGCRRRRRAQPCATSCWAPCWSNRCCWPCVGWPSGRPRRPASRLTSSEL